MRSKRLACLTLALGLGMLTLSACGAPGTPLACSPLPAETVTISDAKLYIEYNAAADDLGVHGAFDDHGWSELCVFDPNGNLVLKVNPQSQLRDLTMAGIFFESREPILEEFDFPDLRAAFPEGEYEVRGINFDGTGLVGAATFTHNVPKKPIIIAPARLAEDEENAGNVVISASGVVIEWETVTETVDGRPIVITGYEIIITRLEDTDPHGYSLPIFDVHVPPDRSQLSVPAEFFEPDTGYELEVLALEESGNQTIAGGYFTTE